MGVAMGISPGETGAPLLLIESEFPLRNGTATLFEVRSLNRGAHSEGDQL